MATNTNLSVKLKFDTGLSNADYLTNNGALSITGALNGDALSYRMSKDNGLTWTNWTSTTGSIAAPTSNGTWTVQVQEKTSTGSLVGSTSLAFTLDTQAAAPIVALTNDSTDGLSGHNTDKVSNAGSLNVTGIETGATVQYSTNGGTTWVNSFSAVEGVNNIKVRQVDQAGNTSAASSFSFTLDTQAAAPIVTLTNDSTDGLTGHNTDKITNTGTLSVTGTEAGATKQYSINGGQNWTTSFSAVEGVNNVQVRQIDKAGNISAATNFDFTLDTQAAAAPIVTLATDSTDGLTGHNTDKVSNVGSLNVTGIETGATVQHSTNGGTTWVNSFSALEGVNNIKVHQVDQAGNTSAASSFSFTLDTQAAAPIVTLTNDSTDGLTGHNTDKITNTGTLSVTGTEAGATKQYSINGGQNWTTSFSAVEGVNNVQVRQIDKAGNISAATNFDFTLDTQAAAAPIVSLTTDSTDGLTGHNTDKITNVGGLNVTGIETGATVQYSADGGTTWANSFSAVEGVNNVKIHQVDQAGNTSAATPFNFTLDTTPILVADDSVITDQDTSVITGNVLVNDGSGIDTLTPASITAFDANSANGGTVGYNDDGTFTYTPYAGFSGVDSFTYTVTDVAGNISAANVFVTVNSLGGVLVNTVNVAPEVWDPGIIAAPKGAPATVFNPLGWAWDADGDALSIVNTSDQLPAGVTYDATTQSFIFDPNNPAYQGLGVGQSQLVTVNYGISDGTTTTATSVAFDVSGSPFTVYDPQSHQESSLLNALLAPNSGIDASNINLIAGSSSAMFYDGSLQQQLGIGSGLLLTSGTMPGTVNTVGWFGQDNGMAGNAEINAALQNVFGNSANLPSAGIESYDATTLSFSFMATDANATSVSFDLVFGSEEYPEWVDQFVDLGLVSVNGTNVALFNHDPMHPLMRNRF